MYKLAGQGLLEYLFIIFFLLGSLSDIWFIYENCPHTETATIISFGQSPHMLDALAAVKHYLSLGGFLH